jgi:hypothetical protein
MKYFRIYTGADGLSYFEDIEVDSSGPGVPETGDGLPYGAAPSIRDHAQG